VGIGAQGSLSLTGGLSTARSICGFGGPFVEAGENVGLGATESAALFVGLDEDGVTPVGGGSISAGIGGGGWQALNQGASIGVPDPLVCKGPGLESTSCTTQFRLARASLLWNLIRPPIYVITAPDTTIRCAPGGWPGR